MTHEGKSTAKLRSNVVSTTSHNFVDATGNVHDGGCGGAISSASFDDFIHNRFDNFIDNHNITSTRDAEAHSPANDDVDAKERKEDLDESKPKPLTLPESTHSLFFTQPFLSVPVAFATGIVGISFACLVLALVNNLMGSSPDNVFNVPANITPDVRAAQYLAIFIALLMEDEIPTGIHLLRIIPYSSFHKRFPNKSYKKFVCSAILRIVLGYIFLMNVFIILAQADGVLDIFYDVLALQFISELDDIAFRLAKTDVFGTRLKRACTAKLFQTKFEKHKFGRSKRQSILLKSVYFLNLVAFLGGMIYISIMQNLGYYQCDSVKVDFGDEVWEDAIVELSPGQYEERILAFSTFNGVYKKAGNHAGRPVYIEMRKSDNKPFGEAMIENGPAEIKYDANIGAWTFVHPKIRQSEDEAGWLLCSPETKEFELLNVERDWSIWKGIVDTTRVSLTRNYCRDKADCNLNGECINSECVCKTGTKYKFLGTNCEVRVKDSCRTIMNEKTELLPNTTWSIIYGRDDGSIFQQYNRPVFQYVGGNPTSKEGDINWIIYTGSRWWLFGVNPMRKNKTVSDVLSTVPNYHAFWNPLISLSGAGVIALSDPTKGDTPVGVDWYNVSERGDQFGAYGALVPLQKDGQVGRGLFKCNGEYVPVP